MNNETRDERLRRLLREADPADPAVTDPGLTLDEAREMRRTILSAVPERRRRLFPVFATAGAVLVAALILIAVLIPRPAPEKPPTPPQIAVVPPKAAVQPPPPREEPSVVRQTDRLLWSTGEGLPLPRGTKGPLVATHYTRRTEEKTEEKKPPVRRKRRAPVHRAPVEPEAVAVLASAEPQQIQFSTPGGTRIIWLLSPGDVSIQGE